MPPVKKIYTIGYEGKSIDEFLKLLSEKGITRVIDVRSKPHSKREEFDQEDLKDTLFKKSMMYKHLPSLGGMEKEDYKEAMGSEEWRSGYRELKSIAEEGPSVMMCLEKDPMQCHRRFISERLEEEGWDVIHLGRGGSWKEKRLDDFQKEGH